MSEPLAGSEHLEIDDKRLKEGLKLISFLSAGIGPRPPCSDEEELACHLISGELAEMGLVPEVSEFRSCRSFGPAYLAIFGTALLSSVTACRFPRFSAIAGIKAAALALIESRFAARSPLNVLLNSTSRNVEATIEPSGGVERTVCLVSHMDSSRSGLMFHPKVTPYLGKAVAAAGAAVMLQALSPVLRRIPLGKAVLVGSRALIVTGFGLVLEREIRGEDVPGANDNASGAAACLCLASLFSDQPLSSTRVVVLVTGSEESGVFGMRHFLSTYDTEGWQFINFDGVGADAPLRVLSKEGGPLSSLKADGGLLQAAEEVGRTLPQLRAEPLADGSGLPYDATPVMAAGGKAISVVNQEGAIPNYHWPSDTVDAISDVAFRTATEFAAKLVRKLDSP